LLPAPPAGHPRMPGTRIGRHELHQLSATPNQKVRRDLKVSNLLKVGMPRGIKAIGEQRFNR